MGEPCCKPSAVNPILTATFRGPMQHGQPRVKYYFARFSDWMATRFFFFFSFFFFLGMKCSFCWCLLGGLGLGCVCWGVGVGGGRAIQVHLADNSTFIVYVYEPGNEEYFSACHLFIK